MTLALSDAQAAVAHRLVPLELKLDFWRYFELFRGSPHAFLLDSARDAGKLGRYSFLGGEPYLVFEAKRRRGAGPHEAADVEIWRAGVDGEPPSVERRQVEPMAELRRLARCHALPAHVFEGAELPFLAGAVGYFGYEAGYFFEKLPDVGVDDLGVPEICLLFVDAVLAHDHQSGRSFLSVVGRGPTRAAAEAGVAARVDGLRARIAQLEADPPAPWQGPPADAPRPHVEVRIPTSREAYVEVVRRAQEHIAAGDIFEVCTTHRIEAAFDGDPWQLYQELRRINPAPFACYLQLPWGQVVSSSPERFLRLGRDRVAESRPIKGTRPRGATAEEDAQLRRELAGAIKDRAENVMIVDLVRNDLGRVCEIDTVHVPELMIVEEYATVFQLVSTIRGTLRADRDQFDLIEACFPGGSMTGAPKIEALKIIDALEPHKRGIYSGAIGYLEFGQAMDLNIVIRTFVVKDGRCTFSVGGAVVADSDPAGEYQESLDKARALLRALTNLATGRRA